MSNDVNETKEYHSVQDMAETQALPAEPQPDAAGGDTSVFMSVADGSQTQVLPTENDGQRTAALNVPPLDGEQAETGTMALQSVADAQEVDAADSTMDDAEKTEASDSATDDGTKETAAKPDLDVPLADAFAQPAAAAPTVTAATAAAVQDADVKAPKRGASIPTIVFGVLGILVGAVGLLFGWAFPGLIVQNMLIVDPRMLAAVVCGVVGVILVLVAVIWAIMGSRKQRG